MDSKRLIELRKEAEKAVADMPDGELKLKAFEVILAHLISGPSSAPAKAGETPDESSKGEDLPAKSVGGRIMVLRQEGFFKSPKSLPEIREEMQAHGWHYPQATIGPALITLVQKRELRRQRVQDKKRTLWKYTNP